MSHGDLADSKDRIWANGIQTKGKISGEVLEGAGRGIRFADRLATPSIHKVRGHNQEGQDADEIRGGGKGKGWTMKISTEVPRLRGYLHGFLPSGRLQRSQKQERKRRQIPDETGEGGNRGTMKGNTAFRDRAPQERISGGRTAKNTYGGKTRGGKYVMKKRGSPLREHIEAETAPRRKSL